MPLPFSKSQIERLGRRLVETASPSDADLDDLAVLLGSYDEVLASASLRVGELGCSPTGRLKNTGTVLEKLRRHGGSWLKSIQDLAGLRVVIDGDLHDQDRVVEEIEEAFASCPRSPKVIDRRAEPRQGYRAVHVVVFPEGVPVEVQVRTRPQHSWAEVFEKLADLIGREIRYGEAWLAPGEWELDILMGLTPEVDAIVEPLRKSTDELREVLEAFVDTLLDQSRVIALIEAAETVQIHLPAGTKEDISMARDKVDDQMGRIRDLLILLEARLMDVRAGIQPLSALVSSFAPGSVEA
ncbi:RelA/SpoT domain-containing protein [Streptomyces sp. NPDC006450]|uniref:RelA/SpoT domain-containing protein n=1 Tax=Streptomyces sp. NPDC006450 TaxID=3155458 RepID=UPI0033A6350C